MKIGLVKMLGARKGAVRVPAGRWSVILRDPSDEHAGTPNGSWGPAGVLKAPYDFPYPAACRGFRDRTGTF